MKIILIVAELLTHPVQWLRSHILEDRNAVDARASGASACGRPCINIIHLNSLRSIVFEIRSMEVVHGLYRNYGVPPKLQHRISQKQWILCYSNVLIWRYMHLLEFLLFAFIRMLLSYVCIC